MDIGTLFTSTVLKPVAQNVLALLFYCSDKQELADIDEKTIDKLFFDSMDDSGQKIIRSDNTLDRLLRRLRHKKLLDEFDDLRKHGVPLSESYFADQFSNVISDRNAEKIAPAFVDSCLNKLAASKKLQKAVLLAFVDTIEQGYWQLPEDAWQELNAVTARVRELQGPSKEDAEEEIDEITLETLTQDDSITGEVPFPQEVAAGIENPEFQPEENLPVDDFAGPIEDDVENEISPVSDIPDIEESAEVEAMGDVDKPEVSGRSTAEEEDEDSELSFLLEHQLAEDEELSENEAADSEVVASEDLSEEDRIAKEVDPTAGEKQEPVDNSVVTDDEPESSGDNNGGLGHQAKEPDHATVEQVAGEAARKEIVTGKGLRMFAAGQKRQPDTEESPSSDQSAQDNADSQFDLSEIPEQPESVIEETVDNAEEETSAPIVLGPASPPAMDIDNSAATADDVSDTQPDERQEERAKNPLSESSDIELPNSHEREDAETFEHDAVAGPADNSDPDYSDIDKPDKQAAEDSQVDLQSDSDSDQQSETDSPLSKPAPVESANLEKEMVRDIGDELMEATNALLDATVRQEENGGLFEDDHQLTDDISEDEAITAELGDEAETDTEIQKEESPEVDESPDVRSKEPDDLVASYEAIHLGSFLSGSGIPGVNGKNAPVQEELALVVVDPLQYWIERDFAIPVRGLRHLEKHLQQANVLYLTGPGGCGKSTLLDGFINGLRITGMVPANRIFHFRFRPTENNVRRLQAELRNFFAELSLETPERDPEKALAQLMIRSNAVFAFDELQYLRDPALAELLNNVCEKAELAESFGGKIIFVARERIEDFVLPEPFYLNYEGLSVAESAALMRDRWKLDFPKMIARSLAQRLKGNPEFMLFVRNWWIAEKRTDTGLQRFLEAMPEEDEALRQYLLDHLFDTFETADSRINGFLKAASLFRVPESEFFLENVYEKIGGGDFQQQLEKQVELFGFLRYQEEFNRYALPDLLREYYALRLKDSSEKRMLNYVAGQLYSRRYESSRDITDAVEGAYHFLDAEREELAALLLRPITPEEHENENLSSQVLDILNGLNFEAFRDKELRAYTLFSRGKLHLDAGEIERADADLKACEALEPPVSLRGAVYYRRGEIAIARDEKEEALQLYRESLSCFESSGSKDGIASASRVLAETYRILGDDEQAVALYHQALTEFEEIDQNEEVIETALSLGLLFKEKKRNSEALSCFETALKHAEKIQDNYRVAELLEHIGEIQTHENNWEAATQVYQKVLQVKRKLNDWDGAAAACEQIGNIHLYLGRWEFAISNYEDAQKLFARSGNDEGLATIFNRIGGVHQGRNSWNEAMGYFSKAREIFERISHKEGIITSLNSIGAVYASRKEWDDALKIYRQSLKLRRETKDTVGIADIQERIGVILREQSHLEPAMNMFTETLRVREAQRDAVGMAHVYVNMGDVFRADNNPEEAIRLYKQGLEIYQKVNHLRGLATALRGLGACYEKLRDLAPSADAYRKAVDYYNRLRDSYGLVNSLYALGNVCHDMGLWQEALGHYHDALPLYEDIGDLQGVARTIGNISSIEFEIEKFDKAIDRQVQILLYFQETGNQDLVEKVLANLVACHQDLGAEVFQPVLNKCLEETSGKGVQWGKHRIITAEKAEKLIQQIFYDA